MDARIEYGKVARDGVNALAAVEHYLKDCSLDKPLLDLVMLRVSQINGCGVCMDSHWRELKKAGEGDQRLYQLNAWWELPHYTEREKAALAWAEAVTHITEGRVPDEVYERARQHFDEEELVDLTLAVISINGWNRMNIALRNLPRKRQASAA